MPVTFFRGKAKFSIKGTFCVHICISQLFHENKQCLGLIMNSKIESNMMNRTRYAFIRYVSGFFYLMYDHTG